MARSNNNQKKESTDYRSILDKQLTDLEDTVRISYKSKHGKWWWIYYYKVDRYFFLISLIAFFGFLIAFIITFTMKGLTYLLGHPEEILTPLIALAFAALARRIKNKR